VCFEEEKVIQKLISLTRERGREREREREMTGFLEDLFMGG